MRYFCLQGTIKNARHHKASVRILCIYEDSIFIQLPHFQGSCAGLLHGHGYGFFTLQHPIPEAKTLDEQTFQCLKGKGRLAGGTLRGA
jgi:hypothetical protein